MVSRFDNSIYRGSFPVSGLKPPQELAELQYIAEKREPEEKIRRPMCFHA
jgi:hypothetical protein